MELLRLLPKQEHAYTEYITWYMNKLIQQTAAVESTVTERTQTESDCRKFFKRNLTYLIKVSYRICGNAFYSAIIITTLV